MRVLDLFCGAGGAAMGYHRAGFEVVGVDINPQPHYPFEFIQADAMNVMGQGSWSELWADWLTQFDAIHASPPCQAYSRMSSARPGLAEQYPSLIEPLRRLLKDSGLPYVIENVPGAPLHKPTVLCGRSFGLDLYRHRLFESNAYFPEPPHQCHDKPASRAGHWTPGTIMSVAGHVAPIAEARRAMGIDWMRRDEMAEAIPPAYTEWIGRHLLDAVRDLEGAA